MLEREKADELLLEALKRVKGITKAKPLSR